jgi:hypothetical protein
MALRWISSNFDMIPIPSRSSHETRKIAKICSAFNGLSAIVYGVDSLCVRLLRRVEALESKMTTILSKLLKITKKRYFKLFSIFVQKYIKLIYKKKNFKMLFYCIFKEFTSNTKTWASFT